MPLHRRVPKRGFTNVFRKDYKEINLERLEGIDKSTIEIKDMVEAGLIKKESEKVKVLGKGEVSSPKTIAAHRFSESAKKKIEKAGGKIILLGKE